MRGILAAAAYVPIHRLDRTQITTFVGSGGGKGTRSVASFDEDTSTMGAEAARRCLRLSAVAPERLSFSTVTPAYSDRTCANTIHAALQLHPSVSAHDANGSVRSVSSSLLTALEGTRVHLVVAADQRGGLPGSSDEDGGGDAAAAVLVGDQDHGPLLAEHIATVTYTDEFVDRWRTPGDNRSKLWEDRFGEVKYQQCATAVWNQLLNQTGVTSEQIVVVISGLHARAVKTVGGRLKAATVVDDRTTVLGNPGAAQPLLLLTDALEQSNPGQFIALVVLSDGAEAHLFRRTATEFKSVHEQRSVPLVSDQAKSGKPVSYGRFLSWRGTLSTEPPRRPEPARASASAADRNESWKFGFVAAQDTGSNTVTLPPARLSEQGSMQPRPMADALGTVATFTVDRLAYSPSPPIVFAIVDFDGGGRLPIELADTTPDGVKTGDRVEMTFRRLGSADGIHNYFWKALPLRSNWAPRSDCAPRSDWAPRSDRTN
jgi:hydroxymethylglutaryl-CoA synthase